ncbi:MAG TPA: methyltransferase domain-containing protein [Thermoanaerobaculia bacterium]|nr:methyltransferase domain-containing protein [Thermoanaerobaculia bacterium]
MTGAAFSRAANESRDATPFDSDPLLEPEWLDRRDLSAPARRRAIADLRRVNRLLFGRRAAVRAVLEELSERDSSALVLDVAAGAGDIGAAVARAAARRGVDLGIVALDRELTHLVLGRRWGDVRRGVVARAEALPFRDGAFDLTLSTLFFHHLDRRGKVSAGAEMLRVSRRAALIVDLVRSRWAGIAARLLFPLLAIGRVAREDGLVSLRRGSRLEEWHGFLGESATPEVRRRFPARVSIVLRVPASTIHSEDDAVRGLLVETT